MLYSPRRVSIHWRNDMPSKDQVAHWKSIGMCSACGKNEPTPGKMSCDSCRQRAKAYYDSPKGGDMFRAHAREVHDRNKKQAIDHYGGHCADCGESDPVVLEFHHSNHDGNLHRDRTGGWKEFNTGDTAYVLKRIGYPTDIELLCANCHKRRHYSKNRRF